MEGRKLKQTFSCKHSTVHARLIIDGGLNETFCLELCRTCYIQQKPKFVISEEVLN